VDSRVAFLFPGQGSQYVGMGREWFDSSQSLAQIFIQTDEICGKSISSLCFDGPMPELTLTENCQPAVAAVSLAGLSALKAAHVMPLCSAGHSVGEYAAMVSAGIVSEADALRLVHKRGALMHREALAHPGGMAAVMGLEMGGVQEIVDAAREHGILDVANHNTAQQIVITGEKEPVKKAVQLAKEKKAKAVPLKVSGAWHSQLMKGGVDELRDFMEQIPFSEPQSQMFFNATAEVETDPERIKDVMANQLTRPVRWYDIMVKMLDAGVNVFVVVGPKTVLSGLLKKTAPRDSQITILNVQDPAGLKKALEVLS